MNPDLDLLQPYPFEKLAKLKLDLHPPTDTRHIALSIGEPKHPPPGFVIETLKNSLPALANYPTTRGTPELRRAICDWLEKRFALPPASLDAERHALPVNGTREALFAFAQAVVDRRQDPLILMPNPFYQIYEGAAFLAGGQPYFLNCTAANGYHPDFNAVPESIWQRCQLLYLCTPGNPTGAVLSSAQLQSLIHLADEFDFVIASDECYSELYFDEDQPPPGLLQACAELRRMDFRRCVVFHSLSKRSNLPGLRSGFVAGDAEILRKFLLYRTYHGCAMPISTQLASVAAWGDEEHVRSNRDAYREKFDTVLGILEPVLDVKRPEAGFYLWPRLDCSDEEFAALLYSELNITVLPGRYIARYAHASNPGENHVRMALVASRQECRSAAERMRDLLQRG